MRPRAPRCGLLLTAALVVLGVGCERRGGGVAGNPRVVVLGFDGIDPDLFDRFRKGGRLPNLDALIATGDQRRLETTTPPLSTVAWTSFSTGLPPGRHGVFGLVRRDPSTYEIEQGAQKIEPPTMLFGFQVRRPRAVSRRHGRTFWQRADEAGVRAVVLRVPYAFPPDTLRRGRALAGVGVPDVRLTTGRYTVLTSASEPAAGRTPMEWDGERGRARIPGLEVDGRRGSGIDLFLARVDDKLRIRLGERRLLLEHGAWSDPQPVEFQVGPFHTVAATLRFYLREVAPELRLYVSPPNVDPRDPYLRITTPPGFAAQLARQVGLFQTLGGIQPTAAYEEDALDEHGFVAHVATTLDWARRATLHEIDQRDAELVVSVFPETDRVSHLFYRQMEEGQIEDVYRAMDRLVGDVRRHLPEDTRLLVVSDHGFQPFRREVSLNAWLMREGLQARHSDTGGLAAVDWSRTRAYSVGLGQIYLNLRGRERDGIVAAGEANALLKRISTGLRALHDQGSEGPVVAEIHRGPAVFDGPFRDQAPDLLVSFERGYRSAFGDGWGEAAKEVIAPNETRWSGGHGGARAADVSGILVSSVPLAAGPASLLDVAPTVLDWLSVPIPEELPGRSLDLDR